MKNLSTQIGQIARGGRNAYTCLLLVISCITQLSVHKRLTSVKPIKVLLTLPSLTPPLLRDMPLVSRGGIDICGKNFVM